MRYIITVLIILTISIRNEIHAQKNNKIDSIQIDSLFTSDFSFTEKWDYAWPVYRDETTGVLKNGLDESLSLSAEDTVRNFFTADCLTDHQGEHPIRYCHAQLSADTLILTFTDCNAAYHGYMVVKIDNQHFTSQWYFNSVVRNKRTHINYSTEDQKLTLNTNHFSPGQKLKGNIDILFIESGYDKKISWLSELFMKGVFVTTIEETSLEY